MKPRPIAGVSQYPKYACVLKFSPFEYGTPEVVTGGVLYKKLFIEVLQVSQENTCIETRKKLRTLNNKHNKTNIQINWQTKKSSSHPPSIVYFSNCIIKPFVFNRLCIFEKNIVSSEYAAWRKQCSNISISFIKISNFSIKRYAKIGSPWQAP